MSLMGWAVMYPLLQLYICTRGLSELNVLDSCDPLQDPTEHRLDVRGRHRDKQQSIGDIPCRIAQTSCRTVPSLT